MERGWGKLEEMLFTCNQENKYLIPHLLLVFPKLIRQRFALKLNLLKFAFLLTSPSNQTCKLPLEVFMHIFKYVMGDQIMLLFLKNKILTACELETDFNEEHTAAGLVRMIEARAQETYGRYFYSRDTGVTLFGNNKRVYTVHRSVINAAHRGTLSYCEAVNGLKNTLG